MLTFNMVWPRGVHDVVDYLATLAASGVGRSAIGRAVQALNFMEKAGGLPEPRWLSQHPLVKATHNELLVTMASGATRATRKAPQMPCLLMLKFEGFVVDDSLQLYWRLFAWYRLLRVWACLRFDDHRGLLPSSLRLVGGSLRGTLVRSKTTGAGKRREELYLHVDRMAYILESSWLEVGWRLWQRCGTARDYFLLLPTADFTGVIELEASYTDSQACSRALMRKVLLQSGEPLVTIPVGVEFWTEHGDRATLPSIAALINEIPSDWIDLLGHWTSKSSVGYMRTMLRRVGHIQETVAHRFRTGLFTVDALGEDDLYAQWAAFMCTRGVTQAAAVRQASVLAEATTSALKGLTETRGAPATPQAIDEDDAVLTASPELPEASQHHVCEHIEFQLGEYVASVQAKTRFRRLHRIGSCPLQPGVDYALFERLGQEEPDTSTYTKKCKHCFGASTGGVAEPASSSASSTMSSTE